MTMDELQKLVAELCKAYNALCEGTQKEIEAQGGITPEEGFQLIGRKEGMEMATVALLHTLLHCYKVETDLELSDKVYHLGGKELSFTLKNPEEQKELEKHEEGQS